MPSGSQLLPAMPCVAGCRSRGAGLAFQGRWHAPGSELGPFKCSTSREFSRRHSTAWIYVGHGWPVLHWVIWNKCSGRLRWKHEASTKHIQTQTSDVSLEGTAFGSCITTGTSDDLEVLQQGEMNLNDSVRSVHNLNDLNLIFCDLWVIWWVTT